ncbi:MAG: hypothetical protein K2R98_16885 [Gemmataceae bacterium]|nr:hypothetical protein [Gemmataceae bacterium]
MQTCSKCRGKMDPKIDLEGDMASILRRYANEVENMRWTCPKCGIERGAKLRGSEIEELKSYIRRKKKQWWQFWIR